jgi:hypothetical protein
MRDLIAKLESAAEGSWKLDEAIGTLVGWKRGGRREPGPSLWFDPAGRYVGMELARFTTSIDAALTLVAAECFWRVGHDGEGPDPGDFLAVVLSNGTAFRGVASTAALAVCIATLKARALTPPQ